MTAPLVKWVGGKTKLMPELTARMPATYGRYYEPFAGGAALFFALQPERAVLGDANADLISAYRSVAADAEAVIELVESHRREHSTEHYGFVRQVWNMANGERATCASNAAAFLYLNRTCFNGLWRVNQDGEFNVPIGRYADPLAIVADRIRTTAPILARAELRSGDYRDTVSDAESGDFVYFDSPYDPLTPTANFTGYAGRFRAEQQAELADTVRLLAARGVRVMASNSDTPFVRRLYSGMRIDTVTCPRAINSNAAKRGAVNEVIVTAGYDVAQGRAA